MSFRFMIQPVASTQMDMSATVGGTDESVRFGNTAEPSYVVFLLDEAQLAGHGAFFLAASHHALRDHLRGATLSMSGARTWALSTESVQWLSKQTRDHHGFTVQIGNPYDIPDSVAHTLCDVCDTGLGDTYAQWISFVARDTAGDAMVNNGDVCDFWTGRFVGQYPYADADTHSTGLVRVEVPLTIRQILSRDMLDELAPEAS